jgi:hypothetical protein
VNEESNGKYLRQVEHIRCHYPRIVFRLDMGLVYHPAHRRNDEGEKTEKYVNYYIFLNASIR